jgi:hypothetical protein
MSHALIDPRFDRVCQIEAEPFPVAAPLLWIDIGDNSQGIVPGEWTYADGAFAPVPPPLQPPPAPQKF